MVPAVSAIPMPAFWNQSLKKARAYLSIVSIIIIQSDIWCFSLSFCWYVIADSEFIYRVSIHSHSRLYSKVGPVFFWSIILSFISFYYLTIYVSLVLPWQTSSSTETHLRIQLLMCTRKTVWGVSCSPWQQLGKILTNGIIVCIMAAWEVM